MSNTGKSTIGKGDKDPLEGDGSPMQVRDSPPPSNGDQSSANSDDELDHPSKEVLSPSRQKRESTSNIGEVSPIKKPKQDPSLVKQEDSASCDSEDDSSTSEEAKSMPPDESIQKCEPQSECPSTPPQSSQSPEKESPTPILEKMLAHQDIALVSPIRDVTQAPHSITTSSLPRSMASEISQPSSIAPTQHQILKDLLSQAPKLPISTDASKVLSPPKKTEDNPLLRRMLRGDIDSPSDTKGAFGINIPPPVAGNPLGPDLSTEAMQDDRSGSDVIPSQPPTNPQSETEQIEASEKVQVEEMADASKDLDETTLSEQMSSHSSSGPPNDPSAPSSVINDNSVDSLRTESDSSSQPSLMYIPPETSEVHQAIGGRLKKMSDNMKGMQSDVSSKVETPGRKSKRIQDIKNSSESKSASNVPEKTSADNPDDAVFKKPEVTSSRIQRMNDRLTDVKLEDPKGSDSPNRRSARLSSKDDKISKESATADKGRSLRPKPGIRTPSDEKLKEGEKSKSLSRERVSKLKKEGDSQRSSSLERPKPKEDKVKPGTPIPKSKKVATLSGSRDRISSEESVADRTRSRLASTSSNNSEPDKTEEDEKKGAMGKRKSRKDSAK